jgi:hypothetical protein
MQLVYTLECWSQKIQHASHSMPPSDTHNNLQKQFQNSSAPGKPTRLNVRENWTSPRLTMVGGITFLRLLEGEWYGPHMELSAKCYPYETKRLTPRQGSEHSLSSFNVTSAFLRRELMPLTSALECLMGDSFYKNLMSSIHLLFIKYALHTASKQKHP